MTPQHDLENDIAYWLEELGFDAVIDALAYECQWYVQQDAETAEFPGHTTKKHWQDYLAALRNLQWELR